MPLFLQLDRPFFRLTCHHLCAHIFASPVQGPCRVFVQMVTGEAPVSRGRMAVPVAPDDCPDDIIVLINHCTMFAPVVRSALLNATSRAERHPTTAFRSLGGSCCGMQQ